MMKKVAAAAILSMVANPVLGATGSAGCGQSAPHTPGTTVEYQITSSNVDRTFLLHLPSNYDANTAVPVIFSFHGHNEDAATQEKHSKFSDEDVNPNAIAVYPQGINDAWEGAPYASGVSDKKFVSDLLDALEQALCVDTTRVYATGMSNGGGFVNVLACSPTLSQRFVAYAPVSGVYYTGNDGDCEPSFSPLPILEFHGTGDAIAYYNGGERDGVELPAILDWASNWAQRNGCSDTVKPTIKGYLDNQVVQYTWDCSQGFTQHYAIADMGHMWPTMNDTGLLDASPIIMKFFNTYSFTSSQ
jgi:poly(3-hydroxybutyrate) depolymerase